MPTNTIFHDGPSPSHSPRSSNTTPTPISQDDFIHNFSNIDWRCEEEPPYPNNPRYPQLYYLLTITGALVIGYYPHDTHSIGEHFLAWAPLMASDAHLH